MADTVVNARAGFITNGVSIGTKHTLTDAEINATMGGLTIDTLGVDGVYEVIKAKITAGATVEGNVRFTVRGVAEDIALLATDTTAADVATKVAAGTWAGWAATVDPLDATGETVMWTATTTGPKVGTNSFTDSTATGVTSAAGVLVTTPGVTAVAEILKMVVETPCTFTGEVFAIVRGDSQYIAVASGDTVSQVATKIAGGAWAGWTPAIDPLDVSGATVMWTATVAEVKAGTNAFGGGTTGVLAGAFATEVVGVTEVTEVIKATIATGSTAGGDLTIVIRDLSHTVAMAGDATDDTPEEVAAKIALVAWVGWTVTVDVDNVTVLWTATAAGAQTGAITFAAAGTGVTLTGTIATDPAGVTGVAEQISLTFTHECSTVGQITINIDGVSEVIAVSSSSESTPELVATQVATGTWAGWTPAAVGAKVTWTATATGAKVGAELFNDGTTGVTAPGGITTFRLGVSEVAEIIKLTIATGCTSDDSVYVTIRNVTDTIALTAAAQATPAQVATAIAAGTWAGWTPTIETATTIVWTAVAAGAKTGTNTWGDSGSTGVSVTGGLTRFTLGVTEVAEIITFLVEAACQANGNVLATIRGDTQTIAITTADDEEAVATAIAAGTWAGWTASVDVDGVTVIWTASALEAKTGVNHVDDGATGIVGNDLIFNFNYNGSVNYPLVARVNLRTSTGSLYNVTTQGLRITYPANGKVYVNRGTVVAGWVAGSILDIIAQRAN